MCWIRFKICKFLKIMIPGSWKTIGGFKMSVFRYVDYRTHILNRFWFIGASVIEITNIANYHNHYNIVYTYEKFIVNNWWWHSILKKLIFFSRFSKYMNTFLMYIYTFIFFFVLFIDVRYCENRKKTPMMIHHTQKNRTFVSRHRFYSEIVPVTCGLLTSARAVTEKCWRKHCWQRKGDCSVCMLSE